MSRVVNTPDPLRLDVVVGMLEAASAVLPSKETGTIFQGSSSWLIGPLPTLPIGARQCRFRQVTPE